jgi:hypothetical protein
MKKIQERATVSMQRATSAFESLAEYVVNHLVQIVTCGA